MIKLLLVEDIEMMKDALEKSLNEAQDIEVVGTEASATKAVLICNKLAPDIVLMDICTAGNSNGIDAAAEIKSKFAEIKVVLMTAFSDVSFEKRALLSGAEGFIYKDIGTEDLIDVVHRTMNGERIFPHSRRSNPVFENGNVELTDREIDVLRLLCKGRSNAEIASELFISENTVVSHVNNLRDKTGITKKAKLIAYAIEHGYIVPGI